MPGQGTDSRELLAVPGHQFTVFPVVHVSHLTSDSLFTYAPGPGPMSGLNGPPTCQALGTSVALKLDSLKTYLTIDSDSAFLGSLPLSLYPGIHL